MFYTDASAAGVNLVATALSGIENLYVQNVAGTAAVSPVAGVAEKQEVTLTGTATAGAAVTFLGVNTAAVSQADSATIVGAAIITAKAAILAGAQAQALGITDITASAGVLTLTFGGPNGVGDVAAIAASATSNGITFTGGTETVKGIVGVTAVSAVTPTQTVDATTLTDTVQFWNNASTNDVTFSNIQQAATIGVKGVTAGSETTAGFVAAVTKGTADSVSVVFDGSTDAGTVTVGTAGAGFETVNVTAIGENKVAALTTAAKTVNITGAGDLEITASLVGAKVIDGSAATGDLTIGAAAIGANLTSVKTGSGDDTVTIVNTNFVTASELAIALGAGDDTLVVAGADNVTKVGALKFKGDALSISGVEFLELSSNFVLSADVALNTDGLAVDTLIFGGNVGSDGAGRVLTLSKFSGDAITFEGTVVGNTPGTHKVALTAADIQGALTITTEAAATDLGLITLANATSLTINAEAAFTSSGITAAKITSLTVDTDDTGAVGLGTVTGAALTTITATGDAAFSATIAATTTKVTSIDLSGLEGAATIGATGSAYAGTVTVMIGEGDVTYNAKLSGGSREIIKFVGDDIGAVVIDDFQIGAGASGDKLDFSQFVGISSADDLVFVVDGNANIVITAASNATGPLAFDGSITIDTGTNVQADVTALVANNLIF